MNATQRKLDEEYLTDLLHYRPDWKLNPTQPFKVDRFDLDGELPIPPPMQYEARGHVLFAEDPSALVDEILAIYRRSDLGPPT